MRQQIHEALHLLQEIEDSHEELLDASTVDSVDNIFCMTVARRVLLTAPPNTIPVLSFQEVHAAFSLSSFSLLPHSLVCPLV